MRGDDENKKTNVTDNSDDFTFFQDSDYLGKDGKKTEEKKEKKKAGKWAKLIPTAIAFGAIAGGVFTGYHLRGTLLLDLLTGGTVTIHRLLPRFRQTVKMRVRRPFQGILMLLQ